MATKTSAINGQVKTDVDDIDTSEMDTYQQTFDGASGAADVDHRPAIRIAIGELILGLLGLTCWFCLFTGGILVGTQPFRETLQTPTALTPVLASWFVVCAFWTVTNVGLLACVASFLGALGRRTRFTLMSDQPRAAIDGGHPPLLSISTYYVSAIMRGFGIYALVLAGILVLATESLVSPTQAAYMRLAPLVSIISFYAGFDPNMFASLLDRVKSFLETPESAGGRAEVVEASAAQTKPRPR
ncbi:hypothetical protein Mal15_28310 [Stieleria maiorica]|uniref:Uncharacterized protein n=1 Tax=Stieleria maiorica TaxID=2795974 RepID=A0A5B9MGV7_9BACT|nr:hypothetical protein [Stieleria maiorica]QEF98775.1 hypothetical protein Mal15_28310 [Stieleria maiorica]